MVAITATTLYCRRPQCATFVRDTRVLSLDTSEGIRIDVIFGLLSFEMEAIRRAKNVAIGGRNVRVVSAEDLILMKMIFDRPRDLADAEALTRKRAVDLDREYLEPRVREFASALERPEILDRWSRWSGSAE